MLEHPERTRTRHVRAVAKAIDELRAAPHPVPLIFAAHPDLTERARDLIVVSAPSGIAPWETLQLSNEIDGSRGTFRAPRASCALGVRNDYEAVQAWLSLMKQQRRDEPIARKRSG